MNLLACVNPVTRLLGVFFATTPLLLSVDVVSAAVVLGVFILVAPLCGVGPVRLIRRSLPLLIAAPLAAVSIALFGAPEGHSYWDFGAFHVTDNSLSLAAAIFVRVLAVGVPVVVMSADVDPTDLGDGLAQVLKLPARFVVATMAATRLMSVLQEDLAGIRRARRARGLGDDRGPRYLFSVAFGLLVGALRRGGKLSTAMEARGFGRYQDRTWARESRLYGRDYAVLLLCAVVGVGAILVAVFTGDFRFLGV